MRTEAHMRPTKDIRMPEILSRPLPTIEVYGIVNADDPFGPPALADR